MAANKIDARQSRLVTAQPMIGSTSGETLDTIFPKVDNEIAKLFEDRNILLAGGGTLLWNSTSNNLTFTSSLLLHINSKVAGGSPTIVDLASTTRAFTADGRMLYAVLDRGAGTAVITADATTLPNVTASNQEVVLIAKRIGNDLYFRNGFKIVDKQSATLSGDHKESVANDNTSGSTVTLAAINTGIIRLTNNALVSVVGIPSGRSGQQLIVINSTGTAVTFLEDNATASANDRIYLGLSGAVTLLNQGAFIFTYDSTSNKWVASGGTGSGSGSGFKNIISDINSKFPGGVADWITYDDGASSQPTDGTGGSPTVITIATTTNPSEVLEGLSSLKISKSAADGQGEGTSVLSKTIDRADRGKPFFVYFSYDASHANYVYGDMQVFAYDVTNSKLLTVYNDNNNGKLAQTKGLFSGVIYTEDTTAQIRLIVHCTSINASAYDVFLDEVVITPQATIIGPVITPFVSYTATIGATTTPPTPGAGATQNARWRRVGDSMEIKYTYYQTSAGSAGSGTYLIPLPAGYAIDTTKVSVDTGAIGAFATVLGSARTSNTQSSSTVTAVDGHVVAHNTTNLKIVMNGASANALETWSSSFQQLSTATSTASFTALVPILDWSAGASLTANDAGLQTVFAKATTTSTGAISAGAPIPFGTEVYDNYQAYNPSTGQLTAPRPGYYRVHGAYNSGTGARAIYVYVGGVQQSIISQADSNGEGTFSGTVFANTGETIDIRPVGGTITLNGASTIQFESIPDFNVFGVQGPVIVGAMTDWQTYTPTFTGFGTVSTQTFLWRRVGNAIEILGRFISGTTTAVEARVSLPNGYVSTSSLPTLNSSGMFYRALSAASKGGPILIEPSVGYFTFGDQQTYSTTGTINSIVKQTGSGITSSGENIVISNIIIPIAGWSSDTRLYPTQRIIGTTYLKDVKGNLVDSGTFTSGSYQTRTLNTQSGDTGFCSLASNQFTLQPGTYELEAFANAYNEIGGGLQRHKAKIRNVTNSLDVLIGVSSFGGSNTSGVASSTYSIIKGRLIVTAPTTFELQHRCSVTQNTYGFGLSVGYGDSEVYAQIKIDKIY